MKKSDKLRKKGPTSNFSLFAASKFSLTSGGQPSVFVSYSHLDAADKNELVTHLQALEVAGQTVRVWSDDKINAGDEWQNKLRAALTQAKVAVLLVTKNFLASRFIHATEVPLLLERRSKQGLLIYPIIGRPCAWKTVNWLQRMQVRPKNGTPVWSGDATTDPDESLSAIVEEIAAQLKQSQKEKKTVKKLVPASTQSRPPHRLNKATHKILKILFEQSDEVSVDQIAPQVGATRGMVQYYFDQLVKAGFSNTTGVGVHTSLRGYLPPTYWITTKGREYVVKKLLSAWTSRGVPLKRAKY